MSGDGIVVKVSANKALVKISKSSACGHDCASCGACSNPSYEMTVSNPINAKAGDRVVIETDTATVLALSFVLYILPVFLLIIASVIFQELSFGIISFSVFAGLILLWICLIKLADKKVKIKNTIVKITVPTKD